MSSAEQSFVKVSIIFIMLYNDAEVLTIHQRDVDFSTIPFAGIFVIHDKGLDWGASVQIITELLQSQNGVLGTKRPHQFGVSDGQEIPLILTNPDIIWKT